MHSWHGVKSSAPHQQLASHTVPAQPLTSKTLEIPPSFCVMQVWLHASSPLQDPKQLKSDMHSVFPWQSHQSPAQLWEMHSVQGSPRGAQIISLPPTPAWPEPGPPAPEPGPPAPEPGPALGVKPPELVPPTPLAAA